MRYYSTKQLGIPYPFIAKIHIGGCGATDLSHKDSRSYHEAPWAAHTHVCKRDKSNGLICVWDYKTLVNYEGLASELLWHEYAHLIQGDEDFPCPHDPKVYEAEFENLQNRGHGTLWKNIMNAMGVPIDYRYLTVEEIISNQYKKIRYPKYVTNIWKYLGSKK